MDLLSMAFEVIMIGAVVVGIAFIVNRATDLMTKDEYSKTKEESKPVEPKRARDDKGHFVADDPKTPNVNEAWVGGEAPKKPKKKKTTKKKKAKTKSQSGGKSKAASSNVKQSKK